MDAHTASLPTAEAANDGVVHAWQRQVRRLIVAGVAALVLALGVLAAWATLAPLAGATVAVGMVRVDTHRKTVQHRDGGIVREILVREGERVAAGQALLRLDDARVEASYQMVRSQLDAQALRQARLQAERDGAATWQPPPALRPRLAEPRLAEALVREQALFDARRGALLNQQRLLTQQLAQVEVEQGAREREFTAMQQAVASMREELELNRTLAEQAFVNRTRVMALERNAADYQSRIDANRAELAQARQRAGELQARLDALREGYRQDASADLRDTQGRIVELEEQLASARDTQQRLAVLAPVAGRVVDLRVTTPGGSIGPRDPLLDIVPDDSPLLVEVRVGVDAIAELRPGQVADVRLTAYRQRSTPLIGGRVTQVSADALSDRQGGAPYYVVQVTLDPASLAAASEVVLQPGMAAEVFIRSRTGTVLDFLVEPLRTAAQRSLRQH
jgi:HlyD family type I secretion membrane fusion protein